MRLNAITHPRIRRRIAAQVDALRAQHPDGSVIIEIPLLLDVAAADSYPLDGIIVVAADEATQVARLRARDGLTDAEARRRLQSQRPLREKIPLATWVIDNSGSPEHTRRQVEALWRAWSTAPA
jgi:dephospho-CoA kinase